MRHRGRAYELSLSSPFPLPDVLGYEGARTVSDVEIVRSRPDPLEGVPPSEMGHRFRSGKALLHPDRGREVGVELGRRVRVEVRSRDDLERFQGFLLGPVLGVLLLQRKVLCIHAGAISTPWGAVAIAGVSTAGKSTTVARLVLDAHPLLADDIVAIRFIGGRPYVRPAYPMVRLWSESLPRLGLTPEDAPVVDPTSGKRGLRVEFRERAQRLACVVVLSPSQTPEALRALSGHERLMELTRHSYGLAAMRGAGVLESHLAKAAKVANDVPVVRLEIGMDVSVAGVADAVFEAARWVVAGEGR
jgi:hypothetical protein